MNLETGPSNRHKQFGINTITNVLVFGFNLAVGLWFTPYLINNLGVSAYGLIPLATTLTSYLGFITLSINGSVGRFLAIDIQRNEFDQANKTFNTAFIGLMAITLLALPLSIGFVMVVPRLFNIPNGMENETISLFFFVILSFFITQVDACFAVSTWAKSRFDLRNGVAISSQVLRVAVVFFLFSLIKPDLSYVGIGFLFAALLGLGGDIALWRYLTPQLKIKAHFFDKGRISELFKMGWWMIINQLGTILFINIDLIIANTVLGVIAAGEYGSILIFSTLLRGLAYTISSVFYPTIVEKYAKKDFISVTKLSSQAVHLLGLFIGLIVGLIVGFGSSFLDLWLGIGFGRLGLLLALMVFHLPINLSVLPLFGMQTAMNKVKMPGIATVALGIVNVLLALVFTVIFEWEYYGIALAAALVLTLKNAVFTPLYAAYIQKAPWHTYIRSMIPGTALSMVVGAISFYISSVVILSNWFLFLSVGTAVGIVGLLVIYFFGLKNEEKILIHKFVPIPSKWVTGLYKAER